MTRPRRPVTLPVHRPVSPCTDDTGGGDAEQRGHALSRRTGLRLAALSGVALSGLALDGSGTSAIAAPLPARRTPRAGDRAVVRVAVTTLWTKARSQRRTTDAGAVSTPVRLDEWNRRMSSTSVRRWLTGKVETQAIYGTEVIVDRISGTWARILVPSQPTPRDQRGYPGWVPISHLVRDDAYLKRLNHGSVAQVIAKKATLKRSKSAERAAPTTLSWNTFLPVMSTSATRVTVALPGGGSGTIAKSSVEVHAHGRKPKRPSADAMIATARRFLGLRYLWGGMSAWGLDCSGFTHQVLRRHGIAIARDAGPQMTSSGFPRISRSRLRRGDLVFFASKGSVYHVAIYLGGGRILHAPNAARRVEEVALASFDTKKHYAGAVRVLG